MSKTRISEFFKLCIEFLRFCVEIRFALISAVIIFLIILYFFPNLTLWEFSLIYWGLSAIAFPINYKAHKWTEYAIKNYGLEVERNPVIRMIYAKKGSLSPYLTWPIVCTILLIPYILAIYTQNYLLFLLLPLLLIVSVLYDFFNDFCYLKKLRRQ